MSYIRFERYKLIIEYLNIEEKDDIEVHSHKVEKYEIELVE